MRTVCAVVTATTQTSAQIASAEAQVMQLAASVVATSSPASQAQVQLL